MTRRRQGRKFDVAFYVPWIGPLLTGTATTPAGGAETQIYLLAQALAHRGIRVGLLAFDLPDATLPARVGPVEVVVRPPYQSHEKFGKAREVIALARTILGTRSRAVVTRAAGPHVGLAGMCAKLSRRRFVHSSANVSDFDFERLEPKRRNRALFALGIRLADEIVVQTEEQVALCERQFGRTPRRIGSIAEPATGERRDAEAFLWVGRMVWYKRPLEYVALAQSMPHARFWMIGVPVRFSNEGPALMDEVRQRAAQTPNLELLEPRPRHELMALVERAVAMVNTADFEGMPNLFLESWGRGVPALALSHDPDGVIERHGLGAFARGSASRLTSLATQLWEKRADQAELGDRCRSYIDAHHSPDAVTSLWIEVLQLESPRVATID